MNYFWFLALSSFCTVLTAAISKMTQENMGPRGVSMEVNMFLIVECGVLGSVFLYFVNGAVPMKLMPFTILMASINTILGNAAVPFTYMALTVGDISTTKLITSVGCMVLPYLFGIVFLKEATTVIAVCGVILIICAIAIPILFENQRMQQNAEKKNLFRFCLYCCISCVLTSASNIVNKLYWVLDGFGKNSAVEYSFVSYLMGAILAGIIFLYCIVIRKRKLVLAGKRGAWFVPAINAAAAILNAISYFLQMECTRALPASVFTPLSTGLTLILTALMAWIGFKEKLSKVRILSILASILAVWFISQ